MNAVSQFLSGINLPDFIKSDATNNTYRYIAERDTTKLALSCVPAVFPIQGQATLCLVMRFLQTVETPAPLIAGFASREARTYKTSKGEPIKVLMADKVTVKLVTFPISGKELAVVLKEHEVMAKLGQWIVDAVEAGGGKMTVDNDMLVNVMMDKLEMLSSESKVLFETPMLDSQIPIPGESAKPETPEGTDPTQPE